MPRWLIRAAIATTCSVVCRDLSAQARSKWCAYVPRNLSNIVSENAHSTPAEADIAVSGDQYPSRTEMRFTGGVRPISPDEKTYLAGYFKFLGRQGHDTSFTNDVEMREDSTSSFWMPIQGATLVDFKDEVSAGDTLTVFALWTGSYHTPDRKRAWVFLLNEFTSRKSADFWAGELATCAN